jgi:ABC-type transporter MlaC component
MRSLLLLLLLAFTAVTAQAADPSPTDLVAQLYQAHRSRHDPLMETPLLARYFDSTLLKLYLRDQREAKGEVGRLDGDPLYNAQDFQIKDFAISPPEAAQEGTRVTVRFQNSGQPVRIVYALTRTHDGWRISDAHYDDGSSLKKILQAAP